MRSIRNVKLILILSLGLLAIAAAVSAEIKVTTTLLPTTAESNPENPDKMLKISASGTDPIESTSGVQLSFDLAEIPRSAAVTNATLRLVGKPANKNPQYVRIFTDPKEESIGTWTVTYEETTESYIVNASAVRLRQIVEEKLKANQTLSLTLSSTSRLSDWNYYSLKNYDNSSSLKPRLIIEYELPGIQESQTTERTNWKFHGPPEQVKVNKLQIHINAIISNPVFYKNGMYLFTQTTSERTDLYALYTNGREMWKERIKVKPASHAVVSHTGILYSVGEQRIARYDLEKKGEQIDSKSKDGLKLSDSPILGRDGSLYCVRSGYGDIYCLNPNLEELWKYPSPPKQQGADKVSRIVLSPDAQRYAYSMIRSGQNISGVRINTADGKTILYEQYAGIDPQDKTKSKQYEFGDRYTDFHRPVVVRGQEQDYVFLSAYSEDRGILAAFSGDEGIWSNSGYVSSPIADKNGDHVFVVQDDKLRAYKKFNGELACASNDSNLVATSNLVMDGEDNVYFWNNGTFLGYTKDCEPLFEQKLPDLPKRLELLFAPDGTLFARSETQGLSLILPTRPAFTLDKNNLRSDTIYSADTIHVAKNLNLDSTANIILKAKDNISFSPGFSVKKGARLSCKTGF